MHDVAQTIPNGAWTPVAFNAFQTPFITRGIGWTPYSITDPLAATTIAAGSNGQNLPQGTINVATNGAVPFATSGFLAIRNQGTDRIVRYTGKTASSFTGCTGGITTTPMATGDAVEQANVLFNMPAGRVGPAVAEVAWASNATGLRGLRFWFHNAAPTNGGGDLKAAVAAAAPNLLRSVASEQPAHDEVAGGGLWVEAFQTSGGPLDIAAATGQQGLGAPRLVALATTEYVT
jgi:hypothetical protein